MQYLNYEKVIQMSRALKLLNLLYQQKYLCIFHIKLVKIIPIKLVEN